MDDATNKRLQVANERLQSIKQPGFIHGDFHGGNVLMNAHGTVSSILDFSHVAYADCAMLDNAMVPWINGKIAGVEDFDAGYQEQRGEQDVVFSRLSQLAVMTEFARWNENSDYYERIVGDIKDTLNETARLAYERRRAVEGLKAGPA